MPKLASGWEHVLASRFAPLHAAFGKTEASRMSKIRVKYILGVVEAGKCLFKLDTAHECTRRPKRRQESRIA